jgi:hypothetical protein
MTLKNIVLLIVISIITVTKAETTVKIINLEGTVKIRYGLEENWKSATVGLILKQMDTILAGENSLAVLQFENGNTFTLSSFAMLDIGDMREIFEKELFLYLMSKKVEQIETQYDKTPIQIGNVSVVRGESKIDSANSLNIPSKSNWAEWEINGALSLYKQQYYPNTVIKLHKILGKYDSHADCGKIFFYIARSLEKLEMDGQAIDAYQSAIDAFLEQKCDDKTSQERVEESRRSINNLKEL